MQDLTKLSKTELIKLLEAKAEVPAAAAQPETPATNPDMVSRLIEQNSQLMAALSIARQSKGVTEDGIPQVKLYPVKNISGMALVFSVSDERTGLPKHFALEKRGDEAKLTKEQVIELQTKAPHFFEQGYVAVPDLVAPNANAIDDLKAMIDSLEYEQINERINQITSKATLFDLFHYIENQRFAHLDASGQPLVKDKGDGVKEFYMEEKSLPPKLMAVETAVQRRIAAISGARVRLDG